MRNAVRWINNQPAARAFGLLAIILIFAALYQPLAIFAYGVTLDRVVGNLIVAVALTLVIVLGEIDLSVGSTMAVAGVVLAQSSENIAVAAALAICAGGFIGLVNAGLVLVAKVNSFIATLGTMTALSGLALLLTGSDPIQLQDSTATIFFSADIVGQRTLPVLVAFGLTALVALFMATTKVGREMYAVGGNMDAARAANISVTGSKTLGFVLCGMLSAVAGVLNTISQGSADPTLGATVLLMAIAAAVLGGAILSGGRGSAIAAAISSIALGAVAVTLGFGGISASVVLIITGLILFVAMVANRESISGLRLDILRRRLLKSGDLP